MATTRLPIAHLGCASSLRRHFRKSSLDVTVSEAPPLIRSPYTTGITCPHGVDYWMEPTSDQIARWVRDNVE